jgi:hypothetical protein
MEDQATEKVGNTYEDKLVQDRKGIEISMPDVEVVSNEPQEQIAEEPQQEQYRAPQNNEAKSQDNIVDENSFDPWEAYYKPDSPSYKLRVEKEKALVNEAVSEQMAGIQSQVAMQNLKTELKGKYGMGDDKEIDDFINFAMTPRDQLPVDFLINVYRQFYNKGENAPSSENIQAVTETQAMPRSAGVLQGGEPNVKSELDVSWDRILKAGNAGRLL